MYTILKPARSKVPIKLWDKFIPPVDTEAMSQLEALSALPILHSHVAVMPDVHVGKGCTIGTVIATKNAIIPSAVGVDIGCGMIASKTSLFAKDLPDNLKRLRDYIEAAVPHGGVGATGAWTNKLEVMPDYNKETWKSHLEKPFKKLCIKYPELSKTNNMEHLGTLGGGNHFIEICLEKSDQSVWVMLHSGSRGVGNRIGTLFIELAKKEMLQLHGLENKMNSDLCYFQQGSKYFEDYWDAFTWAQLYAKYNRECMMHQVIEAMRKSKQLPPFTTHLMAVNCHHNYVNVETHFGEQVFVTRKGAVNAAAGVLGIIPGSMGAKSYIVRGKGSKDSFDSCSHGAGRLYGRNHAKKVFSLQQHRQALQGVECKKDESVLDETPMAYKDIDSVMQSQSDLVEIVHELKQVLVVKG